VATNVFAAAAGLLTLVVYLAGYTPLKRRSSLCLPLGAFAGAMPPVIGALAAKPQLTPTAMALFTVLFVWQMPHVLAMGLMYRDDYARGGLQMLPASLPAARRQIAAWSALLVPTSLAPVVFGVGSTSYGMCAVVLGVLFVRECTRLNVEPTTERARGV